MSVLTQFHFQYSWQAFCPEPLEANPELDLNGIDSIIHFGDLKVGIQIKKISYRKEASERKFKKKQKSIVDMKVEVPYIVLDKEEVKRKLMSKRTKEWLRNLLSSYEEYFRELSNGFVVFREEYVKKVREKILVSLGRNVIIPYTEFLEV